MLFNRSGFGQVDQGAISGVVVDSSGAVIPNAHLKLTETDTGLVLERDSNGSGVYVFSPVKIGNYSISASASGFRTTVQEHVRVDIQQHLNVPLTLQPGTTSETVTVTSSAPLLQTQDAAVGQVISTEVINNTPLNGRNWVYIAQLTAGVAPPFGGTRGSGTGDFVANGQRAEQNNFILDGVDNNTNLIDFLNGSSFVQRPPPDALAEFDIQTSNFSAEFGHSAGAVMNASIKSGTNQIHGDFWEYFRNTNLDSKSWDASTIPDYHENQFGGTLGFPVLKNRLFYFGDIEANRITIGNPTTTTVPTALMRNGDFSEYLNTNLNNQGVPVQLYQPNSGGAAKQSCNGANNVFCANQINPVAQNILKMYPSPNLGVAGLTYNNYRVNVGTSDNTIQWDQRVDWNLSQHDQAYARYSYDHEIITHNLPLGPILDGGGFGGQSDTDLAENFMLSETHVFSPTLTNEFRFGYNWIASQYHQPNANNSTLAASLGLGGVPYPGPGLGGLPLGYFDGSIGVNQWGSVGTQDEAQNVFQILDNVTKTVGNHSLKIGVSFQSLRVFDRYAPAPIGQYFYNGQFTGLVGSSITTGAGPADFLTDNMHQASIATSPPIHDAQWYDSAYFQDDWKVSQRLTLNLGLRYDHYEPYKEESGNQANFIPDLSSLGISTGKGTYLLPSRSRNQDLGAPFLAVLAKDNVTLAYSDNERLADGQDLNFAPRVGLSFAADQKTVIRAGFGMFYGGLQSQGNTNLGTNFPWSNQANLYAPTCTLGDCPSLSSESVNLENGLVAKTGVGLQNFVANPSLHAIDPHIKTPYTLNYSLSVQRSITSNLAATISYVGNGSRHLSTYYDPNTLRGLLAPGVQNQPLQPFPDLGGIGTIHFAGVSNYNSLQAKLEKRASHGLSFLATYTYAHALDDTSDSGGLSNAVGDRNLALIPFNQEYTNSPYDIRHRFTLNGNYELPFGKGRAFFNQSRWEDEAIGGWSTSLTFAVQTGTPFTVSPSISTANGGGARAILVGDPFKGGGNVPNVVNPDGTPNNPNLTSCPAKVKNLNNWYNPCAFINPLPGNLITGNQIVTNEAQVLSFLGGRSNQIYGPGYNKVDMSLFKNFATFRSQFLQFRADAFNLLNHPTWGNPSNTGIGPQGGQITGTKFFQNNTPDARFLQLSLKYNF
ncbi:TonB-dependent receptor domain-containing protein [Silvibacterium acidisoli]|uniref:TonB-dependent receptor domain-containing protein n=1 Tax=Acidobacteriaceae bacterium ZG23-2 TaxID=2883246 RepID=UPI00406C5046